MYLLCFSALDNGILKLYLMFGILAYFAALGLPGWIGLDRSAATAIVLGLILLSTALTTAYKLYYCRRNRDLRVDETRTANTGEYHGMYFLFVCFILATK